MLLRVLRRIGFTLLVFAGAGVIVSLALALAPGEGAFLPRILSNLEVFFTFDYAGRRTDNLPLIAVLLHRSALTFTLIGGALLLTLVLGLPTGMQAALRPGHPLVNAWAGLLYTLSAMPLLVLAILAVLFATRLFGLPPYRSFLDAATGPAALLIYLLPMGTLALGDSLLADVTRTVRLETARILEQDYVLALRARGVAVGPHLLRGLLPPLGLTVASKVAYLIGGSVVVEYVFGWQGLGFQVLDVLTSAGIRDDPFLLAATALFVGVAVILHLISELAVLAADPRLRAGTL